MHESPPHPDSVTQAATPEQNKLSAKASIVDPNAHGLIAGRYELQGVIAKGGMGEVHKAWDRVMLRTVAVKFLLGSIPTQLDIMRFNDEARITGKLQHPSIPPVHDIGTLDGEPNGMPFLVMKLIKGQTLDQLIKTPNGEKLNVLAIFEAISQAIGYAHSQGVIHRDLKPQNIMVGAFGEVQVMDWGLAKFRVDAETALAPATIAPSFYDLMLAEDTKTSAGSILGTPAYMPPEQAVGAIEKVTERSDVFGLGGILCALLTGKPVFMGGDAESSRQLSALSHTQDAFERLDACGADAELIALAKRCLAANPSDRPANGSEVATITARLRADAEERARQAEISHARSETRRRILAWSAAAVFTVLCVGVVTALVLAKQARAAEQATAAQLDLTQQQQQRAEAAEAAAIAKTKEVEATLVVVGERTKLALDAFNQMVFGIQNKLELRPGTQELRRELLEQARTGLAKILDEARKQGQPDSTLIASHTRMGDVERQLGNMVAAEYEYHLGYELAQRLADADPSSVVAQRDLSLCLMLLGDLARQRGQAEETGEYYQKSLTIRQRLHDADPKNPGFQRDLSISYTKLGDHLRRLGRPNEALALYQKNLALSQQWSDAEPRNPIAQRDLSISFERLGHVSRQLGQLREALEYYQKNLLLCEQLAVADPKSIVAQRDVSICLNLLGDIASRLDKASEALEYYHRSLVVRQRLADADPKNTIAQQDLMRNFYKVGMVHERLEEYANAIGWYEKALAIATQFERSELFKNDVQNLREIINDCRVSLQSPRRELAPPPRAIR